MNRFKMLGSTKYGNKEYTISDAKKMVSAERFGLVNFYGGRVKQLGETSKSKSDGIYLCIENLKVIDIIKFESKVEEVEVIDDIVYEDDKPVKSLPRKRQSNK